MKITSKHEVEIRVPIGNRVRVNLDGQNLIITSNSDIGVEQALTQIQALSLRMEEATYRPKKASA